MKGPCVALYGDHWVIQELQHRGQGQMNRKRWKVQRSRQQLILWNVVTQIIQSENSEIMVKLDYVKGFLRCGVNGDFIWTVKAYILHSERNGPLNCKVCTSFWGLVSWELGWCEAGSPQFRFTSHELTKSQGGNLNPSCTTREGIIIQQPVWGGGRWPSKGNPVNTQNYSINVRDFWKTAHSSEQSQGWELVFFTYPLRMKYKSAESATSQISTTFFSYFSRWQISMLRELWVWFSSQLCWWRPALCVCSNLICRLVAEDSFMPSFIGLKNSIVSVWI